MEPTLVPGQRVLVDRMGKRFGDPSIGEIVVFHPPAGSRTRGLRSDAAPRRSGPAGLRHAARRRRGRSTTSSASSPARATKSTSRKATSTASSPAQTQLRAREGLLHPPCEGRDRVQLPDADQDSARTLVHDGGQPWRIRRQQVLGTGPDRLDHRRRLLHLLAAQPRRHPLGASRARCGAAQPATQAARPFRLRPQARTHGLLAGADEAGRGSLAGPLVAAAVLFDYESLGAPEQRLLRAPQRLQAAHARGTRGALPARAARRAPRRRRLPLRARHRRRGLHNTNLAALREALQRACTGHRRRATLPDRRLRACPSSSVRSARSWTVTRRAPRSPPPRSSPR